MITTDPDPRAVMDSLATDLKAGADALARAHAAVRALTDALQRLIEAPQKSPMNAPVNPASTPLARGLSRGKIEACPDLERFCQTHARTMTFPDLATAIVQHFGPARRVSVSSIHRWWHRRGKALPTPSTDKS